MRLVLEPPRSVDDQRVDPGRGGLLDPVIDDPGRVAALLAGDDRRADPLSPDLQLLDRRRAERVARGQHHAIILFLEQMAKLADRRRLARPVDPDHQNHVRPRKTPYVERFGDGRQDALYLFGQDRPQPALIELLEPSRGNRLANPLRRRRAHVRRDQCFLDVVERRRVERHLRRQPADVLAEPIGGLLEPARQALEPTHANSPINCPSPTPVTVASPLCPRTLPATNMGANPSL